MALLTALATPPIVLIALGAVQIQSVMTDKNRTQDAADAAALWGAQQLTVSPVGAEDRTIAFAGAQLENVKANAEVTVTATVLGKGVMKVVVETQRPSFFMNLMPAGGFHTRAEAIAEGATQNPLCVITFGNAADDRFEVTGESQMQAPLCLIHANERIEVGGKALLKAETIETGTSASGPMTPSANTGAPDVEDPFASIDLQSSGGLLQPLLCPLGGLLVNEVIKTNGTLAAGPHCGDVEIKEGITATLAPGEHYFAKKLVMKNGSQLTGSDVVVVAGKDADLQFKDGASVILHGRKSGPLAGFVIAAARDRDKELKLDSDPIRELTGTIYVPNARLNIEGNQPAAQASDWTVMAVQSLRLTAAPQVQINADYAGSDVPVPTGVGNKVATTHLTN